MYTTGGSCLDVPSDDIPLVAHISNILSGGVYRRWLTRGCPSLRACATAARLTLEFLTRRRESPVFLHGSVHHGRVPPLNFLAGRRESPVIHAWMHRYITWACATADFLTGDVVTGGSRMNRYITGRVPAPEFPNGETQVTGISRMDRYITGRVPPLNFPGGHFVVPVIHAWMHRYIMGRVPPLEFPWRA
ncbi:hypothetical protein AVEN_274771-1 [Araneus ventricosus]|uniref:Uncharacterized protein n=1 Tax=Araneus ventricosus TaxID=182803 RepID=A0A4Y2N2T8_ARAVE|nr:hypothetical protein AVEN_274771-1 [Araneus ventricosus]